MPYQISNNINHYWFGLHKKCRFLSVGIVTIVVIIFPTAKVVEKAGRLYKKDIVPSSNTTFINQIHKIRSVMFC